MKTTLGAVMGLLLGVWLNVAPQNAQAQSKENFDQSRKHKSGFFSRIFSSEGKKAEPTTVRKPSNQKQFSNKQRSDANRKQADAIFKQQQAFREEQREKKLNRQPTEWELAHAKQEKKNRKELKKIMKERDKRLEARTKSKQKAMAAMVRYNKKKNKPQPAEKNTFGADHFSSASASPGAGTANRRR